MNREHSNRTIQTEAKRAKSLQNLNGISGWSNASLPNITIIGVPEGKKRVLQKSS